MLAAVNGEEIAVPRMVVRQTCRDNTPAGDATEHYRLSLFLPFLDFLVSDLETRFKTHADILSSLQLILHKHCTDVKPEQFENCIQFNDSILPIPALSNLNWSLGRKNGRWCPMNSDHILP